MRLKKKAIIALVALSTAIPTSAFAFQAWNGLRVNPEGPAAFEVVQRYGRIGATDIWCAAGDYALRALGMPGSQRVYLTEGKHFARTETRERYAYSFSLTPPPEAEQLAGQLALTLNLKRIGDSLSVTSARQYCDTRLGERWYP